MAVHQRTLAVQTRGKGLYDVTSEVARVVRESGVTTGLCTVFVRHTSASLVIQENAAPSVRRDLERWAESLAPESGDYEHDDEGPDDMPAHVRAALTAVQLSIPVVGGRLALGTWQGIYVFEHREMGHRRSVVLHLLGE